MNLEKRAASIRRRIIIMNANAGAGHTGADLSETDILTALYFHVLDIDPERMDDPNRDRFILSKGHGAGGYYCTLAEAGYIDEAQLESYLQADSLCPGHPVRQKTPGVEVNTGALGHGFPIACGLALAARKSGRSYRTFCLCGDGEMQEGSNWEAAMTASHFKLGNLVLIIDRNGLQLADRTGNIMELEPLGDKIRAFGFTLNEVNGNDPDAVAELLEGLDYSADKPHAVIAKTIKGRGVSFIEDNPAWHHRVPMGKEIAMAIEELG
ncbi:MAG: transketolase [Spirochaetaceae bacterium]|nr:transketolase [Spirochaetaceae bacterium]